MWMKWIPWRFVVRRVARAQGFLDPISLLSSLQRFSQPSEVMAPTELLRAGAVLQARGLMNSQAIQHNLDWIWPFWVERQFDPYDVAFVPRAFNVTHINLTHRNWTAVGVPDSDEMPIVDPRGLVTPLFDGWSVDAWIFPDGAAPLVPARVRDAEQKLSMGDGLSVETRSASAGRELFARAEVGHAAGETVCRMRYEALSDVPAWLVVSLRPYNPEGVSFIHHIASTEDQPGWKVNGKNYVRLSEAPERLRFSRYERGDVSRRLDDTASEGEVKCDVGMATAAALYRLEPGKRRTIVASTSLPKKSALRSALKHAPKDPEPMEWEESLRGHSRLVVPDAHFRFLYEAAIRTLVLHSPGDVYPGPYTYKRFWFRDAAFILHALICVGLAHRAERVIDRFPSRQTPFGYFLSQEGEWDSNGEALWTMRRWCELTGKDPKAAWKNSILRAGKWIVRKRLASDSGKGHAGLMPAGFSAEHLGPNDFYYWDDFWSIAGLEAAAWLCDRYGASGDAAVFRRESADFSACVDRSVASATFPGTAAVPASPYRRLDAGSIGSIAGGYPLQLWKPADPRLTDTANFLMRDYFVEGGFFQQISHSGINPYLTLHVAQILLRAGDPRHFDLTQAIARLASPTGQWPEAVHPQTKGGCMGDGQHVWAAAEWVLMLRNMFVREEEAENRLVIAAGIPPEWTASGEPMSFGETATTWGPVSVELRPENGGMRVTWSGQWRGEGPEIAIRLPGFVPATARTSAGSVLVNPLGGAR